MTDTYRVIGASLDRTAALLARAGKRMVIMQQVPNFSSSVKKCVARARWWHADEHRCATMRAELLSRRQATLATLQAVAARNRNVTIYDPLPALCGPIWCAAADGADLLYADNHHPTAYGSIKATADFPVGAALAD